MTLIPNFPYVYKKINSEYKKFAESFSDTWVLMIIAHFLGIFIGVMLAIVAAAKHG